MDLPRNILKDLDALVALPWLDRLAAVLERHDPGSTAADYRSIVLFLAARWRTGSCRELESLLAEDGVWERVSVAAERAGLRLSRKPPTYQMVWGLRRRLDDTGRSRYLTFLADLQEVFTEVAVEQAQKMGLLQPGRPDWKKVARGNTVAADGSSFKAASDLTVDDRGQVQGSRSDPSNPRSRGPRVIDTRPLKGTPGVPVAAVTVREKGWHRRVMLSVEAITGDDETSAAWAALDRLLRIAGTDAVHCVVYDRLFAGDDVDRLLRRGVLPVVAMRQAGSHTVGMPISEAQAHQRYFTQESRKKRRLVKRKVMDVAHGPQRCGHTVWGVDGSAVIVPAGAPVTPNDQPAHAEGFDITTSLSGDKLWHGRYSYECGGEVHTVDVELTGTARTLGGRTTTVANCLRPVPEADPRFPRLIGFRQDIESTFATIKWGLQDDDRVLSYDPDHFTLDALAGGVLLNAIAWDVNGPGTPVGS